MEPRTVTDPSIRAPYARTLLLPPVWRPGLSTQTTLSMARRPTPERRTPAELPGDPLPSRSVVGVHYRLVAPLGEGGVGEVWRATDLRTERPVALKLMRPELGRNPTRIARFLREGRLALDLRHPNIVEVLEVGRDDDRPFLAMELLPGPSLGDLVELDGPLPWARVRSLLKQLALALAHAHAHAIVHHDVKPSNVVLANAPGQPDHGKLLDFGIARRNLLDDDDAELTFEGQMLGSPGYMSPEQIRGTRVDPRSDLFGLGCTAFFLLTGRDPFEARTLPALIHSTLFHPTPTLPELGVGPSRQRAIEAMIQRALEKDPADRYASANEMLAALQSIPA